MKKSLLFVLLVCTLCALFCLGAAAETYEGKCGENITFKYDPQTLTLTFSGKGELEPYEYTQPVLPPWRTEEYGKDIKHVVIEEGITHIGKLWLSDCDIQSISIPDSAVSINEDLFHRDLKDAPIYRQYNGADYIGNEQNPYVVLVRVHDNTATHYDIHPDTKIIHTAVFYSCSNLNHITLPQGLKTIGSYAFAYCPNLTDISLPNSITHIESYAFTECRKLKSINIPTSLTTLNEYVFNCCLELESIHIPRGLTEISFDKNNGCTPFYACGGLEFITVDPGNPAYYSDGNCLIETASGTLLKGCNNSIIPDNQSITRIAPNAFAECKKIKSIAIPQGVVSIGNAAFLNCSGLMTVALSEGLTSIEDLAFYKCSNLKSINIPDGVQSIGTKAFCLCSELEEVILPVGVSAISNLAFADVSKVTLLDPHTELSSSALHRVSCISGYENSTAHEYAKQNDIEFISLGEYIPSKTSQSQGGCGSALSPVMCLAALIPAALAIHRKKHKTNR